MVLITNEKLDTWGIGLLELVCKVVEALMYTWIKTVVQFHNVLHGFQEGSGGET